MTEYIDRQALLKKYCKEPQKGDCKRCDWYGDTWCRGKLYGVQIAEFPAADVAPARHGTWSIDGQCSECGKFDVQDPFGSAYCPHCGAMMEMGDWV